MYTEEETKCVGGCDDREVSVEAVDASKEWLVVFTLSQLHDYRRLRAN